MTSKVQNQKFAQIKRTREVSSDSQCSDEDVLKQNKRLKDDSNQIYIVTKGEMMTYFSLLEDPLIYDFLNSDSCLRFSDKYLLAMVFAYFKRASYAQADYTRVNFFVALFLANDMEEDEEDFKYDILPWALGRDWRKKISPFLQQRDKLWKQIGYRAIISNKCCLEVLGMEPNHWAWSRERPDHHAGAVRVYPDSEYFEPRGPYDTPRGPCDVCRSLRDVYPDSQANSSWYISSGSSENESPLDTRSPSDTRDVRVCQIGCRFDMEGLKKILTERNRMTEFWPNED